MPEMLRQISNVVLIVSMMTGVASAYAKVKTNVSSAGELEYGPVLYEYFKDDFFLSLVEQAYAEDIPNAIALSKDAQIVKGGVMLSYGMADEAKKVFDRLLDSATGKNTPQKIKNKAWYYLGRLYYLKGELTKSRDSLQNIKGKIPADIHLKYHYLATILSAGGLPVDVDKKSEDKIVEILPDYAYLLFNQAIRELRFGKVENAVGKLEKVVRYSGKSKELSILSDRARLGLAQIAVRSDNLEAGWKYLQNVSTVGLYSNRALLSYAWTAIKRGEYTAAVPALQLLEKRSIEIPEVQESKVLLAHLYEQLEAPRKALKSYLLAEKSFQDGIAKIEEARAIIQKQNVPREFVLNLEALMDESAWFALKPSVDYKKLTPFLVDLMASNPFNETLKELADLYEIKLNLEYWSDQAGQHILILNNAASKVLSKEILDAMAKTEALKKDFAWQSEELQLKSLTLEVEDQDRLITLINSVESELKLLDDKIERLQTVKTPYRQPRQYGPMVIDHHKRIKEKLKETEWQIAQLEPVMRKLVNAELNKHEERMRYYWAQSRLAKARLYDTTLLELEDAQSQADNE